ncbi:hypothetical protein MCOR17_007037 [Pyricularia oryzae]|uniref:Uncharacterized protein n=1 Tax=Pyricularia oryzae TaxID=318829 RepID=A0A4V1C5C3_PYROR|nr:hypothetical protein MCOR17_007037 [Pyricularia oryzae]QBZ55885.1 hypothetical protein PoMZ_00791 [Pyricularia oryzae]
MHKRAPLSTPPTSPDGSPQRRSSAVGAAGTESHCPRPRRTDTKILPAKFISDTGALIRALAEELGGTTCFHIEVCSNAYNIRSTTGEDIDMRAVAKYYHRFMSEGESSPRSVSSSTSVPKRPGGHVDGEKCKRRKSSGGLCEPAKGAGVKRRSR